jgi:hypothetical protein
MKSLKKLNLKTISNKINSNQNNKNQIWLMKKIEAWWSWKKR